MAKSKLVDATAQVADLLNRYQKLEQELATARQEQGALRAKIAEWREASDRPSYQCADELEALLTEVKR